MSKATTPHVRGRQPRIGLRMLLAAGIVAVPTCLISYLLFIGVAAQVNVGITTHDLVAGLIGFVLSLLGGVVVRRYAFLAVAAALHALWWSLAIHHLLRVMAIATLLDVLHWNAAAILYGLFAVVAGGWLGVTYGRRLLGD